jgi:hypothetical protein
LKAELEIAVVVYRWWRRVGAEGCHYDVCRHSPSRGPSLNSSPLSMSSAARHVKTENVTGLSGSPATAVRDVSRAGGSWDVAVEYGDVVGVDAQQL